MDSNYNKEDWYHIQDLEQVDTPALVVYLDRVKSNIAQLINSIDDVQRLRPHVKTHKTREGTRLMMEAGIRKFKCATIAEAEMLAQTGAPDVLLAYQPVGPKVQRLLSLAHVYPATKFSCLVDDGRAAQQLSESAVRENLQVEVVVDINVGMNRTGVTPDIAYELYQQCLHLPGIRPVGLHVYDGHINEADLAVRTSRCEAAFAPVEALKERLVKAGVPAPLIIAGGSPTFPIYAKRKEVECSPGTFIFWDAGYQQYSEQPFLPAALVLTRVISLPGDQLLCTDLGHKSIAPENPLNRRVVFLNAPELTAVGQSEEHLVLQAGSPQGYPIGDVLYGLPVHICPTCAQYERALVVENGRINGEWKIIARDRKLNT